MLSFRLSAIGLIVILAACQSRDNKSVAACDFQSILPSGGNVDCGYLVVPENHENAEGRKIKIAYVVLRAQNADSKEFPVIYLSGGPGGSSLDKGAIEWWYNHPFRINRDVILVDQRGIGYSSALPNPYQEFEDIMAKDLDEDEETQMIGELFTDYAKKCNDQGIELQYYNTFQNARDLGALMDHLGYPKYNLYGASYGTRLARATQDIFPEKLNSVILNSPNPMQGDMIVDRLKSYSLALSRVFEYCKNNPDCHKANPTLQEDYFRAIEGLRTKPMVLNASGDSIFINEQDGIFFLRRLLYGTNSRTQIPALIKEYLQGGGPIIEKLAREEYAPDYNFAMWLSVERHEMFDPSNTQEVIAKVYDLLELLPYQLGLFHACYVNLPKLHNSGASAEQKRTRVSSVPTLITVNHFDPVTPPENGKIMMKTLTNGHLFILDEGGHGGGDVDCRNKVMIEFMNDPNGQFDSSCLNVYKG